MTALDLTVGGTSVIPFLRQGSLALNDAINDRSVLSFSLVAPSGYIDINVGSQINLKDQDDTNDYGLISQAATVFRDYGSIADSVTVSDDYGYINDSITVTTESHFTGTVDDVTLSFADPGKTYVNYNVNCADNHKLFDRRYVAESYVNKTVYEIIDDLYDKYISDEGITIGTVGGSDITITDAVFSYQTLTKVFDTLAERTGYIWYIDADKTLNFKERDAESSSFTLEDTSAVKNISVRKHREQYRNTQYVKDGRAETEEQTETFSADGEQKTFVVAFPLSQSPTITVDGSAQTVGIRGVDDGKDFYWNKGKNEISSAAAESAGSIVSITYIGEFDVLVKLSDDIAITERQTIEGGTGIYENVLSKEGVAALDTLTNAAFDKIREFGSIGSAVTFTMLTNTLRAGMVFNVSLPKLEIDETDMLITNVSMRETGALNTYEYSIEAVTGEALGGWSKFFSKWLNPDRQIALENQSDFVAIPVEFSKTWVESESPNPFYTLYPSESVFPSDTLYPMIHPGSEVKYIEWSFDDAATARKARTYQSITANTIKTIVILNTDEAIGNITDLAWAGGLRATSTVASGLTLDTQEYLNDKTKYEMLQITKYDYKGW